MVVDYSADRKTESASPSPNLSKGISAEEHKSLMKAAEEVGLSEEVC